MKMLKKKYEAMGWNTILVKNGNNYDACSKAILKAKKSDKPTIIIFKTIIGIGTRVQGNASVHAYPLPAAELSEFKKALGVSESFFVPQDVYAFCKEATDKIINLLRIGKLTPLLKCKDMKVSSIAIHSVLINH